MSTGNTRPSLSYLIEHAESWVHETDAPTFYADIYEPKKGPVTYALEPEDIQAKDPRVLTVLRHFFSAPEHNHHTATDSLFGNHLRACILYWDKGGIPYVDDDTQKCISQILKLSEVGTGLVAMQVLMLNVGKLDAGFEYAFNMDIYDIEASFDWLTVHFPDGVERLRLAQGLGLSPEETAVFIQDEKPVLHTQELPRGILLE